VDRRAGGNGDPASRGVATSRNPGFSEKTWEKIDRLRDQVLSEMSFDGPE
jgi:hypothetical protein